MERTFRDPYIDIDRQLAQVKRLRASPQPLQIDLRLSAERRDRFAPGVEERGGKAKLPLFSLSLRTTSSVEIDCDPQQLPASYQRTKIVSEPDKANIKRDLEAGKEIEGCRLKTKTSVVIK